MRMRSHARLAALAVTLASCSGGGAPTDAAARDARPPAQEEARVASGPVVATVDGEPITLSEVQDAVNDTGLSPIDALHRLEEERVLYRRALASGSLDTEEADRGERRAMVQALLRVRVEDAVGPESVTDAEIMARYDATRASFVQPERRTSVHVLASVPADADAATLAAAEQFARRVIAELSTEADPAAAADRYRGDASAAGLEIVVEHLPPASRNAPLEAPYLEALFSRSAPGVVSEPAHTTHGFHAVVVTAIDAPFRVPLDEAEPMLRRQILAERRGAALDALDRELRARTTVSIDPAVVARAVEADLFADEPPLGGTGP
jgi:hypothetical protein